MDWGANKHNRCVIATNKPTVNEMMTDTSGRDKIEWNSDTREKFDTNDSLANENKKCKVMWSRRDIFSYLDYTLATFLSSHKSDYDVWPRKKEKFYQNIPIDRKRILVHGVAILQRQLSTPSENFP